MNCVSHRPLSRSSCARFPLTTFGSRESRARLLAILVQRRQAACRLRPDPPSWRRPCGSTGESLRRCRRCGGHDNGGELERPHRGLAGRRPRIRAVYCALRAGQRNAHAGAAPPLNNYLLEQLGYPDVAGMRADLTDGFGAFGQTALGGRETSVM